MPIRLKVLKNAPNVRERLGARLVTLRPGQVFEHPDDARAKRLLSLRPAIVEVTKEATAKEVAAAKEVLDKKKKANEAKEIEEGKKASKAQEAVEGKLTKLGDALKKMKEADVAAEAKKRKLEGHEDLTNEEAIEAILADERAKLEKE